MDTVKTTKKEFYNRHGFKGFNTFQCYLCNKNAMRESGGRRVLLPADKIWEKIAIFTVNCSKCGQAYYVREYKPIDKLAEKYNE